MINELAFVPRNKSFNMLQIWPSGDRVKSEIGETFTNNLINGDKRDREIENFTERPRLGQISRHNTKLTPGVSQDATSTPEVQPQLIPPSSTTRRWLLSSRAFDKSSSKGMGRITNPDPRGCAIGVVSPVPLLQNVHIQVTVTGTTTRKGRRRWRRKDTARRRVARHT
jgi:hypothetical protein